MQTSDVVSLREYVAGYLFGGRSAGQRELEILQSDPDRYSIGDREADTLSAAVLELFAQGSAIHPNEDWLVERVAARAVAGYVIRDQGIQEFLESYPNVAVLIWDGHALVRQVFGDDATPALDLRFDPEDGGDDILHLSIETALPPDEAMERLRELDRVWDHTESQLDESRFVMDVVFR